jgi:predicted transcriptional regulator
MATETELTCRLDADLAKALDRYLASVPGETRASIIRRAVAHFLLAHEPGEDILDEVDFELAEEARRRMEDDGDEVIPYEQARAELGL